MIPHFILLIVLRYLSEYLMIANERYDHKKHSVVSTQISIEKIPIFPPMLIVHVSPLFTLLRVPLMGLNGR